LDAVVPKSPTASASGRHGASRPTFQSAGLVAFACASLLSGCATYQPRPLAPAALTQSFEARTLRSPDLQRYIASQTGGSFDGGQRTTWDVESLTLAAFYFSPELDAARAKSATSEAAIQTAAQRPNPTLQIPFQYTANAKPGESAYTLGLGLDIPIETDGKRGYRTERARRLSAAARLEIGNVAWQVRSRLRTQLINLHLARKRSDILEKQAQVQQQIVQMLEKRVDVGAAAMPEVRQARAMLDRSRLDLAGAAQQAADARAGAAAVIGLPPSALALADIRLDSFEEILPELPDDTARSQAVLNRADVRAALASYEASQSALQLEIANQYPDIHIGPGYTYDAGAHKFAMSLSGIQLPMFNRNEGPIAEAEARRAEAAAQVNAVQARASGDAARAAQNHKSALARQRLAQGLLETQKRQLAALRKVFQAGETDRLSLAIGERDLLAGTLALSDTMGQLARSAGELEDAMQRPLAAAALSPNPRERSK
jgi:cobalt-zinc-cadmium efflux system outer membrane protein